MNQDEAALLASLAVPVEVASEQLAAELIRAVALDRAYFTVLLYQRASTLPPLRVQLEARLQAAQLQLQLYPEAQQNLTFYQTLRETRHIGFIERLKPDSLSFRLDRHFLSYLNLSRDEIAHHRLRFVLCLRLDQAIEFQDYAGDLWDFRQQSLYLQEPPLESAPEEEKEQRSESALLAPFEGRVERLSLSLEPLSQPLLSHLSGSAKKPASSHSTRTRKRHTGLHEQELKKWFQAQQAEATAPHEKLSLVLERARWEAEAGALEKASDSAREVLHEAELLGDPHRVAQALALLLHVGVELEQRPRPEVAQAEAAQAEVAQAEVAQAEAAQALEQEVLHYLTERPPTFSPSLEDVAEGLLRWGLKSPQPARALPLLKQARLLFARIAPSQPERLWSKWVEAGEKLAHQLSATGQHEEASNVWRENVNHLREGAERRSETRVLALVDNLHRLCISLVELEQWEEALQAMQEAVALSRQTAEKNPDLFALVLAMSLQMLGVSLGGKERWEEALQATQEAVGLYRRRAEKNPATSTPLLAESLHLLGIVLRKMGRPEEALASHREAVLRLAPYFRAHPQEYAEEWSRSAREFLTALKEAGEEPHSDPDLQPLLPLLEQVNTSDRAP
ncbi:MAG: hypothetical protein ACKO6N_00270 [Myxococcota bacterium]